MCNNCRYLYPEHDRIIREVFGKGLPSAEALEKNISLLMHLSSGILTYPQAFTPNVVHVGATQIHQPNPLPKVSIQMKSKNKKLSTVTTLARIMLSKSLWFLQTFLSLIQIYAWIFSIGIVLELSIFLIVNFYLNVFLHY